MAVVLTSRTDDSAIDMELSHLSDVPEEESEHLQEKETLLHIDIDIPVPKELEMPHTPRMPSKTFADIRDDPPASTSTPMPEKTPTDFKIRRPSKRKSDNGLTKNNSNNSPDDGIVLEDSSNSESKDDSSSDSCEECKPVQPKSRGQFGLLLACVGLSILIGFLIGFYVRGEKYRIEKENEVCVVAEVPTSLTAQQLKFQDQAMEGTSKQRLQQYARTLAQSHCMSGTPCSQNLTNRLVTKLKALGLPKVDVSTYNVLVSHPVMTKPSTLKTMDDEGNVMQTIVLYGEEEVTSNSTGEKPATGGSNSPDGINKRSITDMQSPVPMYMPYSASGTAKGELLYVNCASMEDFMTIQDTGIDATGRVAIARQCNMMTTEQVKNVEDHGMVGLIIYQDPADIPNGQPMGMTGMYGDPLTPGCPSIDGIHRTNMSKVLPTLPVQTVSTDVAAMLLGNITGKVADDAWHGALNITYHIGRKSNKPSWMVELDVHNTMEQQDIHNVLVTIPGTDYPDQHVMMGGHYTGMPMDNTMDSTATGSTAMILEVATGLADMLEDGWQPKRTVMLGLWEGAEMGSSGATEWVEEHRMAVADRTVAYIDMDAMVGEGSMITAETSPVLKGVIMDAAQELELTDVVTTTTLDGMGEHVPFSHMLGVPSVSLHTTSDKDSSPVPNLDASTTMLATKTLLLLADEPIIQYDGVSLAEMVDGFVDNLGTMMKAMMGNNNATMESLKVAASQYMQQVQALEDMVDDLGDMTNPVTLNMINQRLMHMENAFTMEGTSGMMRHILHGTQQMETFPIIVDAMSGTETVTPESVEEMLSEVQCVLRSATTLLSMPS